jgi:hypothetical protein
MIGLTDNKRLLLAIVLALGIALVVPGLFAQETTAGLQGTVKDPSGAIIPKATVEVTSPALIGAKRAETDQGYFRFANLPPGVYTLTVTVAGFRTYKQDNIDLQVGHLPTIDPVMQVGTATETIEISANAAIVDVTQSRVQTNIPESVISSLPTGRSFQSVIQFAPGARSEPLQQSATPTEGAFNGGYQIDGASNSENSYLVEGLETADVFDGHSAANLPMDFVQEVQVKTSGFEAENGGALGGVVNVVPKRGSNEWHGSLFAYYNGDGLNSAPNPALIRNPEWPANANGAKRLDQPAEYYYPKKDHFNYAQPGFTVGGYLIKDRLWTFIGAAPEFTTRSRTLNLNANSGSPGPFVFNHTENTYYTMARLDFLATQKIRLYGSWVYQYARATGATMINPGFGIPTGPQPDDVHGQFNSDAGTNPNNFNNGIGYVRPNVIYNFGADITLTPNLVATSRYGYFYHDYQDRGLPAGIRYRYIDTNYPYSTGNAPALAGTKALDGTSVLPTQFVNSTGWASIGANSAYGFDQWKRYNLSQDLAWFKNAFGTHNVKFGYAFNHGTNDVFNSYNTADVYVAYNVQYAPQTTNGQGRCRGIIAQNLSQYGAAGGSSDGSSCQGLWGTVNLRDLATTGKVGGWNHAFYVQDAWTVARRLTINAGVRLDKENLPSYSSGNQGISFGWGDKVAPRFGAAYDVLGNGKVKVYGSFGYFFDIMKYQLTRGSFGGDYWHDCVYALDTPDFTKINPQRDAQGHYCPLGGGATPAVGSFPAGGMRFIENYDFRVPSNDPTQIGSFGKSGLIDPNLKPMKQHEMVFGAEWAMTNTLAFEARYSRKRLDRTIEDAGIISQDGEVYAIVNPGFASHATVSSSICNGCPANPKAIRNYDGLELRMTKKMSRNWYGAFSYTYSRLYGNYSGLTATDVSDTIGRDGANTDRAFDEPFMSFDAHGKPINGPLATDRPNTFKIYTFYNLRWWKFNTDLGLYQQVYSGTPLSSYISVWGAPVFVEGRGKVVDITRDPTTGNWAAGSIHEARTPRYVQSDLSVSQDFHISKSSEAQRLRLGADCFNCFNNHSATIISQNMIRTSGVNPATCGTAGTNCTSLASDVVGFDYASMMTKGYDYIGLANSQGRTLSSLYGNPLAWQARRTLRLQVIVTF